MPRRPQTAGNSYLLYFGGFNRHLNLLYVGNESVKIFNVLELDDVTQKWLIKYRVHINRLISLFPEIAVEEENKMFEYEFSILL